MMATAHALVGCAIASKIADPVLAGTLIVSSHWVMDLIPHWDFGTNWEKRSKAATGMLALGDTVFAFLLSFIVFSTVLSPVWIIIAVSLANLPDWAEAPWFIFFGKQGEKAVSQGSLIRKLSYWTYKYQELYGHTVGTFPHGVFTQVFTVGFFLLLLQFV